MSIQKRTKPHVVFIPKRVATELRFRGCDVGKDIFNLPKIGSYISNEDLAVIMVMNDPATELKTGNRRIRNLRCGMGAQALSDKWMESCEGNDTYTSILVDANVALTALRKSTDIYDKVYNSTLNVENFSEISESITYEDSQTNEYLSFYKGENCVVVAVNTDFNLLDDTNRLLEKAALLNVLKMLYEFTGIPEVSSTDIFKFYIRNILTPKLSLIN